MSNFYSVLGEDDIGQEGEQKLVDVKLRVNLLHCDGLLIFFFLVVLVFSL
jgi:hypothetical protein